MLSQPRRAAKGAATAAPTLEEREAEYRKLNADLEARTARLVEEAQAMINRKSHEDGLGFGVQSPTRGATITTFDFAPTKTTAPASAPAPAPAGTSAATAAAGTARPVTSAAALGRRAGPVLPAAGDAPSAAARPRTTGPAQLGDNDDGDDGVLEAVLNGGLGEEATLRFLKAKVRSLHGELRDALAMLQQRDSTIAELDGQLRAISSDQGRADRAVKERQTQLDKLQRQLAALEQKHETDKVTAAQQTKEIERLRRDDKKHEQNAQALEVRLNRALEESDKMRQQLKLKSQSTAVTGQQARRDLDDMTAEIATLKKQKATLLNAFQKQTKLIDVLRRQRLHVEAAKVLAYGEDEFTKLLEWGNEL